MEAEETPTPVPAEHTGQREPAPSGAVRGLAEAIAEQIAAQELGANTISGSFDVKIDYSEVEYALTVKAPVSTDAVPMWIVSGIRTDLKTGKSLPFLNFKYADQNNWTAGGGLPLPITFSNGLEIKHLYGEFVMKSVASDAEDAQDAED